ncbi:MAG: hypothetical protein DWP97_11365 [Calditrichaeota bacterium]|nr:MAG: hypothetical protein DWP97_11365 [Calditrichota bacterium]
MKKFIILFCILLVSSAAFPVTQSVSGFDNFLDYRETGEVRLWTIIVNDSVIGTLRSTVTGTVQIDGISGYTIEEKLNLDFNKSGTPLTMNISNEHYVTADGFILGDKMELNINGQQEKLDMQRKADKLEGYITRGGQKIDQSVLFDPNGFSIENYYYDQLELYLSAQTLTIGDNILDSVYMPQSMTFSYVNGFVRDFDNIQLFNQVFDSCFVIEFTEPLGMIAYFTEDKKLVKVDIPNQNLKAYLDVVQNPEKVKEELEQIKKEKAEQTSSFFETEKSFGAMIGVTFIYILFGILSLIFFAKNQLKSPISFIALFAGGVVFVIVPFTQVPLQEILFKQFYVPNVLQGEGSPFLYGLAPAIVVGLIQELLKIAAVILFVRFADIKSHMYTIIGTMIGVGFGVVEACYLAGGVPTSMLFTINLIERGFTILFHVTSGALLGYALSKGIGKVSVFAVLTIVINSLFRYLPIFAQSKTLTPELLNIILAIVSILFLSVTLLQLKKTE